jgi:hypothetical protein
MTSPGALEALAEAIASEAPEIEDPADVAQLILERLRNAGYEVVAIKSARG